MMNEIRSALYELHNPTLDWVARLESGEPMRFDSRTRAEQMAQTFRAVGGIRADVFEVMEA